MMFPEIVDMKVENKGARGASRSGKSFLFDFKRGDFVLRDGRLVRAEELSAIKVWIEKVIRTEKSKFEIYKDIDYGITLMDLIGRKLPRHFVESELRRELKEAILKHPRISDISKIETENEGAKLKISFLVSLIDSKRFKAEVNI